MRATVAVKRLDNPRWVAFFASSWLAVLAFNWATMPLMFPGVDPRTFISSGAVVGLALPLAVTSLVLAEGPPELVLTAGRSMWASRLITYVGYVGVSASVSLLAALAFGFPPALFAADALLLAALVAFGVGLLGLGRGWVLGVGVVLVMSVPGLVPWDANWVYRIDRAGHVAAVAAVVAGAGGIAYGLFGSFGVVGARFRLGTAANAAEDPGA